MARYGGEDEWMGMEGGLYFWGCNRAEMVERC